MNINPSSPSEESCLSWIQIPWFACLPGKCPSLHDVSRIPEVFPNFEPNNPFVCSRLTLAFGLHLRKLTRVLRLSNVAGGKREMQCGLST
jgi:hypothetical protein